MNRRAAESDLVVYCEHQPRVDGRRLEEHGHRARRLRGCQGATTTSTRCGTPTSFMDQDSSELHRSNWRQGDVIKHHGPRIFQIETTLNTNTFGYDGPMSMLQKREWEWSIKDRASFAAMQAGLKAMSSANRRRVFHAWRAPYELTSVQAGEVEAVHRKDHGDGLQAAPGTGRGPDRRGDHGPPVPVPLQRQLDHEPDPGDGAGPGVTSSISTGASRSCGRAAS